MAIVDGVNSGIVTTAPTSDPEGANLTVIDGRAVALKITTTDAITISEIGWYTGDATQETNFEVGIYSHNGGTDGADTRLFVDTTNAKGTGAGWKVVTGLSWDLDASTTYWIAVQCDNVATTTNIDRQFLSGERIDRDDSAIFLPSNWDHDIFQSNNVIAVYALVEEITGVTRKIKIGGTFVAKPIKTKVGGTFVDKPIKIKVGGTFQDT